MEDKRFAHVATDPKFRNIRRGDQKVKIDKRFQSMFKDKKFKVKYSVDKRGRIVNQTSSADLRRYYHLSSEESSSDEEASSNNEDKQEAETSGTYVKAPESDIEEEHDELASKDTSDKKVSNAVQKKLKNLNVDYARGESNLFSESSSDEEDTDDEINEEDLQIEHKWGELDADADRTDETTHRLAVCNLDWDRIHASDLMVLFNSFVPQGGLIKTITIYPSEFGKQRMKEEELKGPIELVEQEAESDEENEDGAKYHMEKLRQYQLNRLKYFYAVVECDSETTANKIYTECDGMEYESSAAKIDLRFIPDDMTFDDTPREICDKLPDLSKYQPRFFTNSALQQAKVDLTWDETNPDRIEITQKLASGKVDDITESELQNYLASSSGEDSEEEKEEKPESEDESGADSIDKYRALLSEIETKEKNKENKDVQLEISWGVDLQEKTEKLIKKKQEDQVEKTPFQQYLDKRKEKRKEKREQRRKKQEGDTDSSDESDVPDGVDMNDPYFAEEFDKPEFKKKAKKTRQKSDSEDDEQNQGELELLLMNEDDSKKHFSLKKIQELENDSKSKKKKNKKKDTEKMDDFEIDVKDDRFSALYSSHHFNIDPTDPHYKKTKAMEKIISEKLKRRVDEDDTTLSKKQKTQHKNAELNVLVKSVKRKAEALANKKSK